VEINIVCEYEYLLDVVALNGVIAIVGIIIANINHFTNDGADNEQCIAVHTGNRIVNNNDFVFYSIAVVTAANKIIEIQECDKIALALT
jgi:hypothetical protein